MQSGASYNALMEQFEGMEHFAGIHLIDWRCSSVTHCSLSKCPVSYGDWCFAETTMLLCRDTLCL